MINKKKKKHINEEATRAGKTDKKYIVEYCFSYPLAHVPPEENKKNKKIYHSFARE